MSPNSETLAAENGVQDERGSSCRKTIVLVGMMGAGKSTIGKRLAMRLGMPFTDADTEIERAAGCSIPNIFSIYGEEGFRDGEKRVIARLLDGPPHVLAAGGGAFNTPETREAISRKAISVWLKADVDLLYRRVVKRTHRPLLNTDDQRETLERLCRERDPIYALADITVDTADGPAEETVEAVLKSLKETLPAKEDPRSE